MLRIKTVNSKEKSNIAIYTLHCIVNTVLNNFNTNKYFIMLLEPRQSHADSYRIDLTVHSVCMNTFTTAFLYKTLCDSVYMVGRNKGTLHVFIAIVCAVYCYALSQYVCI